MLFDILQFTLVISRKQQGATGVSGRQPFAAIIFHSVLTIKSIIVSFQAQKPHIFFVLFFPMLSGHFSLPVTCKLLLVNLSDVDYLSPSRKFLYFSEILDLGVIVISQDTT